MKRTIRIGIEGLTFDSANYTPGSVDKCRRLHGHTFRVDVEIEGEIDPTTGMVMDFLELKRIVKEVLEEYDHRVLLPVSDRNLTSIKGRFDTDIKFVEKPHVTTEYLALDIAEKIMQRVNVFKLRLRLYEGSNKYALVELEKTDGRKG